VIASAGGGACAVVDGGVQCWGDNRAGTLVIGASRATLPPTPIKGLEAKPTDVSMASRLNCVIDAEDGYQCWGKVWNDRVEMEARYKWRKAERIALGGDNAMLRLEPDNRIGTENLPFYPSSDERANDVFVGKNFACLESTAGAFRCSGRNDRRQLARGGGVARPTPWIVPGLPAYRVIAVASEMTCGLEEGSKVSCVGASVHDTRAMVPVTFSSFASVDDLFAGGGVVCALSKGIPTCWGKNRPRVLMSQNEVTVSTPQTLGSLAKKKALAFGGKAGCMIEEDGKLKCFGGGGNKPAPPTPVPVEGAIATGKGALSLGSSRGCVLHVDTSVSCFSLTPAYDERDGFRYSAHKVPALRGASSLTVGDHAICAFDKDKRAFCVDEKESRTDITVDDLVSFAMGDTFACGLSTAGEVKCWGSNRYGELGQGDFAARDKPTSVTALKEIQSIGAGPNHVCALARDKKVWCWGKDDLGQSGSDVKFFYKDFEAFDF
jgi:hypothetical protein